MYSKHSRVIVKSIKTGKVIKKLDIKESNYNIRDTYTLVDNNIQDYLHRFIRKYTLG